MSSLARTLLLLFFASTIAGCDSSAEFEDCVFSDDPGATPGSRRASCPSSVFPSEDRRAREVFGVVRRGEDVVPGAIVRAEPSSGLAPGAPSETAATTITNGVGFFDGLRTTPLRYDLSVKLDREGSPDPDLLVYRGLGGRYIEPSIEGPRTFTRAWTSRVDVRLDRAVPAGHSVAFFASGDGVYGVTGDLESGLTVLGRAYALDATLHVVEFETAGGLVKATAYGTAGVPVDAGVVRLVTIALQPIPFFVEPKLTVKAPAGFAPSAIDVRFGFTRTSDALLASIPIGSSRSLPIIPNAGYTYRVTATTDGVVSDSGENGFDVLDPVTEIELPAPPTVTSPLEGETRGAGEMLLVDGEGVFEHVLVPQAGGPTMRIITRQREAVLPDVAVLGSTPAVGPYTWTVRSYPTASFADELGGLDSRRFRPMGVSRSRSILLR